MSCLNARYFAAIAVAVALGLFIAAGCVAPKTPAPAATAPETLGPGPNDPRIAYESAQFLENYQYSLQLLDTAMSEKFFTNYLASLDSRRVNFLQSDIDEFDHYRTNLDKLTVGGRARANLTPAYDIFDRYLERLEQHTAYVDRLLKQDNFKFDTDEHIELDRSQAPYPRDLAEAEQLWRQELRYEFLKDKLDREFSSTNGGTILPLPKTADAEIATQLARDYNWYLRTLTNWDSDSVLQVYLNALTHAYDPHTDYMNGQREQDFVISMSLQLAGIGAQLSEIDGYCTIDSLIAGGPADQSRQINHNDRILAVAQSNQPPVNVVDVELPKVVELIRGPKGSQVRLTVEAKNNPSSRHVVVLTRDIIKLENQEAKAQLIELPGDHGQTNRIGVVDVPSFYAPIDSDAHNYVSVDVAKLIQKLERENVAGIILDMRNNPGGSLDEAVSFTGLFIKEGPVVLARDTDSQIQLRSSTEPDSLYSGPLVILLNRFSASAAEIAAAALQDYGRALIVGDTTTHGKGTVQSIYHLQPFIWPATPTATNDPGELKITIRKFYRITGETTQLKGVESDIVLPDLLNYDTGIGEGALGNAMPPGNPITGVDFTKLELVQPYLAQLRRRSETRVATNQDFDYIRQDIDEFRNTQADKTATLNEQQALNERRKAAAEKSAHDRELAARGKPNQRIFEITVENAGLPGLPPPLVETNSPENISETQLNDETRLNETERILEDYITLLPKNYSYIANQ